MFLPVESFRVRGLTEGRVDHGGGGGRVVKPEAVAAPESLSSLWGFVEFWLFWIFWRLVPGKPNLLFFCAAIVVSVLLCSALRGLLYSTIFAVNRTERQADLTAKIAHARHRRLLS